MIAQESSLKNLIKEIDRAVNLRLGADVPLWFREFREDSFNDFMRRGIPTIKDEEWKYTNLRNLTKHNFRIADKTRAPRAISNKIAKSASEIMIVVSNGAINPEFSDLKFLPEGVTVVSIEEAVAKNEQRAKFLLSKYQGAPRSPFVSLNEALNSGVYITVNSRTCCPALIHIVHLNADDHPDVLYAPRTIVDQGPLSEVTILESYFSLNMDCRYWTNALTDVFLEENAVIHYCKSQHESLNAFHIGQTRVWQERNSVFDGFSFMAGGALTRNNLDVVLNAQGASATLNALYSVFGSQHVDNHTSVDHRAPLCTSNQLYKGILNHSSRAVFNGKIFVRSIAQQTNSYQLNKNLLLGDQCHVDTKPQLEISADDVKCTHGATIGQLNDDEMFYLQTRCIPRSIATQMLARGFVDDLLSKLSNRLVQEKINDLMRPSYDALIQI